MRSFRGDRYRGSNTRNAAPILNNELEDLDMELEILQRQREIIKQKQMGSLMSERQNMYDYPSSSYDSNDYQNFGSSNKMAGKSFKRPSDRNWPSTSAPKQSRQLNPWQDNNPTFRSIRAKAPLFKKKDKPIPKNTSKPRSDFNPTKVTKAKTVSNKPHTNISQADKKTLTDTKGKKVFGRSEILRPFVDPTPSMKGRLELALGEITKDIKQSNLVKKPIMDQTMFASTQKQVKNVIRERISSIMMNKIVGAPADIVALYRKSYPDVVDEEIMNIINSATALLRPPVTVKPICTTESEEIRAFFKSKINQLLTDKMQEMIDNLGKLYGDNEKEILKCITDLPDLEKTPESNKKESKKSNDKAEANISNAEENKDNTAEDITNENDNAEENKDSEENSDGTGNTGVGITKESDNAEENKNSEENSDGAENTVEGITKESDNAEENNAEENTDSMGNNIEVQSSDVDKEDTTAKESDEKDKSSKIDQYYKLMDLLIINRIPKLLAKFKDTFANVMYCEKDFIIAKEMTMKELKDKLRKSLYAANSLNSDGTKMEVSKTSPVPQVNGKSTEVMEVEGSNTANTSTNNEQLFVMLLGRPSLPSKPVIYEFLNKFKPQSIKKHKTVNNLLVISFNNKQDYDNILAANESKVGDSVFIIKANEVIPSEKTTDKVQDSEVNEEMKEPENTAETTEDNKMETIEENEENDEVQIIEGKDEVQIIEDKDEVEIIEERSDVTEVNNETNNEVSNEAKNEGSNEAKNEVNNEVKSEKEVNVATPVRSSSRLANVTPSTIKTRRASRLAQNN